MSYWQMSAAMWGGILADRVIGAYWSGGSIFSASVLFAACAAVTLYRGDSLMPSRW